MNCSHVLDFRLTQVARNPQRTAYLHRFLASGQLTPEKDIHTFVEIHCDGEFAGCLGLAGKLIKCVMIAPRWRGENLLCPLLSKAEDIALMQGYPRLFLYTDPVNTDRFRHCGFWPIASDGNNAVLMENTPAGLKLYCRQLSRTRKTGNQIAAIVMNANPFTLGHLSLAEYAAGECDWLHLFVVREDASFFPFSERLLMVKAGVAHLPNVTVHEGSDYMISRATFPDYFLKEKQTAGRIWSEIDIMIFRDHIAPALGITHRFIGSEPFCLTTRQYNQTMHRLLSTSITVVELPRVCHAQGVEISASEVRHLLKTQQFPLLQDRVPLTTFLHLTSHYRAENR